MKLMLVMDCSLAKRLPRMLFPPGTTAADFEYEAALGVLVGDYLKTLMDSY